MSGGSHGYSFPVRTPDPIRGVEQILIVCHANQCRSPYAEAIAERIAGDAPLRFTSGGLIRGGRPMPETGRLLAPSYGLDFDAHRSREIDLHDFGGFDLILTMAREQARELVAADPDAWPRIFTLKQFSRWIVDNPRPPRAALGSWLDAAAAGRPRTSLIGRSDDDDVADPLRLPVEAWRHMVAELTENLTTVVAGLER
ncbi:MAG: hypothetical protein ABWY03_01470 [Microbacterium sp.]